MATLKEIFGLQRSYLTFMLEEKGELIPLDLLPNSGKAMALYIHDLPEPLKGEYLRWFTSSLAKSLADVSENWKDRLTPERQREIAQMERELGIAFHTNLPHGVPLAVAGFSTFRDGGNISLIAARLAVESWLRPGAPYSVVLAGGVGVGKSHLLEAAALELMEADKSVLLRREGQLNAEWRSAVANHLADEVLYALTEAPWLIIDDIGTATWGEAGRELMDTVYDARWRGHLKTLVATNVKAAQLPARIASRLGDAQNGVVVSIMAPDYRLQAKK